MKGAIGDESPMADGGEGVGEMDDGVVVGDRKDPAGGFASSYPNAELTEVSSDYIPMRKVHFLNAYTPTLSPPTEHPIVANRAPYSCSLPAIVPVLLLCRTACIRL